MPLPGATPPLSITTDKVCGIVVMARERDAKDERTIPDPGSDPADDRMIGVLEDGGDDPISFELGQFIDGLNFDEQIDLVALTWLGRDGGTLDEWASLRSQAEDAHNARTASYLLGIPLLADYLEEALSLFGRSCLDLERDHL